jgi:hypothetical protein
VRGDWKWKRSERASETSIKSIKRARRGQEEACDTVVTT